MEILVLKKFYERDLGTVLLSSLWVYLIGSILHKFDEYFYLDNFIHPITAFVKSIFLIFFFSILTLNFKLKRSLFFYLGSLSLVYIFGNFKWSLNFNTEFDLFKFLKGSNIFYLSKYLYPIIFLGTFSLIKNKEEIIDRYFGILEKFLLVNVFFVFLGVLFSIDYFQSYPHSSRFGYDGILERLFFVYFSVIVISRRVFLNKVDFRFWLLCLSSLLSGTKLMLLFFFLLYVFYLFGKRKFKVLSIISIVFCVGILFFKQIVDLFVKIFPFWLPLLTKYGHLTVLLSDRDLLFHDMLHYFSSECSIINFLFGGMEFAKYATQLEFIDLFLFFGVIGSAIYISLLSKIINKYYHFIPLIASFFAGGFLFGTIIICTYFLWMYETHNQKNGVF